MPYVAARKSLTAGRLRRWPLLAIPLALAIAGAWLVRDQLRPRDAQFSARRRTIVAAHARPLESRGAIVSESVHVTARDGLAVAFRVLRPARTSRPLPLIVLLGGYETGRDAVELIGNPGSLAVAALDYPYAGPAHPHGWRGVLAAIPRARRALLDTPPAISLAVDWLARQPWVDRDRIELVGASLGVPFVTVAGALDPRFHRVWLIHGAAGNHELLEHLLRTRIPHPYLRRRVADLLYLLSYGPTLEPARWVPRIAPRPVVVIGAAADERLPRKQVEALYAAARQPKEMLWTPGRHIEPGREDILRELVTLVRRKVTPEPASTPD